MRNPRPTVPALEKLATWMQRHYAPLVAVDPPAGLMLDATGVAHLFGGETDMLREIIRRLAEVGIAARIAIAPSYGAAFAAARTVAAPTAGAGRRQTRRYAGAVAGCRLALVRGDRGGAQATGLRTHRRIEHNAARALGATLWFEHRSAARPSLWPDQRAVRSHRPAGRSACAAQLRRADRCARDDRALHRQARRTACRSPGDQRSWRAQLDLLFFRVDNRIESIRVGTAGRCET